MPSRAKAILGLALCISLVSGKSQATPLVYIGHASSGTYILDGESNAIVGQAPIPGDTLAVAVSPAGDRVYLGSDQGSIHVVSTATDAELAPVGTFPVGAFLTSLALTPSGSTLFASVSTIDCRGDPCASTGTLIGIDLASTSQSMAVATGAYIFGIALHPSGRTLYAAGQLTDQVFVISPASQSVTTSIQLPAGAAPSVVVMHPFRERLYVSNVLNSSVTVIDTTANSVLTTIAVPDRPFGMAISPSGEKLYVASQGTGLVSVIDTASDTIEADIQTTGRDPTAIALDRSGDFAYTANLDSGDVSVLDMNTGVEVARVPTASQPISVATSPIGLECVNCDPTSGCVPRMRSGCRSAVSVGGSTLSLDGRSRQIAIGLQPQGVTMLSDFGMPTARTSYTACLTDGGATPQTNIALRAPAGGTCDGRPCWSGSSSGFKYSTKLGWPDGLKSLKATAGRSGRGRVAGRSGRGRVSIKAKGPQVILPDLPFTFPLRLQIATSDGSCWEATFSNFKKNTAGRLTARSD
jgi:YVTN family beta-propeller protein